MPTEIDKKLIDEAQTIANRTAAVQFLQANYLFLQRSQRRPDVQEKILEAIIEKVEPLCPKLVKPTIELKKV